LWFNDNKQNDYRYRFETATAYHPCSVGIVTVENGIIVDEFVTNQTAQ
jgi:hypothetical protein